MCTHANIAGLLVILGSVSYFIIETHFTVLQTKYINIQSVHGLYTVGADDALT